MINTRLSSSRIMGNVYWIITLFIFAFIANNDKSFIGELRVLYIPGTKWLVHLLFLFAFCSVWFLLIRKLVLDKIMLLLFLKTIIDVISTCFINTPESLAFIVWTNIGLLVYIICRNVNVNLEAVLSCYELFALLLSIQSILTGISLYKSGTGFNDPFFKSQLRIPFAGSNIAAGIISSSLLCTVASYSKTRSRLLFILKVACSALAILFIRSRGSILLLLIILDLTLVSRIRKMNEKWKKIIWYFALITTNAIALVFALNSSSVEEYFSRNISTSLDISSGRFAIWQYAWSEFLNHPLFGRGISFTAAQFDRYTGAHNIWLDTLMSSGIIGFLLHMVVVFNIINRIRFRYKCLNKTMLSCVIVLLFLYSNSLIEVSYYNYINDVIFWSLSGFLFSEIAKGD